MMSNDNNVGHRGITGNNPGGWPQGATPWSSRPAAVPSSMVQNAPAALNPLQHAPHPSSAYRHGSGAGLQVRETGAHANAQGVFGQNHGYGSMPFAQQQRTQQPITQPSYGQPYQAAYSHLLQQVPYGQPYQPPQYGHLLQQVPYGQPYQAAYSHLLQQVPYGQPYQPPQYSYLPQQVPYSQPYQPPQQGLGLGQLFGNAQASGQTIGNRIGAMLDSVMPQSAMGFQHQMTPVERTFRRVQSNHRHIANHPDYPPVTAGKIPHGYKWTYKEESGKPTKAVALTVLYEEGGVLKERDYIYEPNGARRKVEPKRQFSKEHLDKARKNSAAYQQTFTQPVQQPHQVHSAPFMPVPPQVPPQHLYGAQPVGTNDPFRNPVPMSQQTPVAPPAPVVSAAPAGGSFNAEGIYIAGPPPPPPL